MPDFDPRIIGTWRLVRPAQRRRQADASAMRAAPMGVTVFSADRRMIAVLCDFAPVLPAARAREYSSIAAPTFDGAARARVDLLRSGPQGGDQVGRCASRAIPGADAAAGPWQGVTQHRGCLGKSRLTRLRLDATGYAFRHPAVPSPETPWP
jgi:hypothetical protein